jgi:dipeptidyl aminopeptidase/acylaminoacyl peptidase
MKKHILTCLMLATAFVSAIKAQTLLSPELLWKITRISDERVSPDGTTILFGATDYVLSENKGYRDLYLVRMPTPNPKGKEVVKSGAVQRITQTPENEQNARWRPDGKKIGYLSSKSGSMQLWEMNPDGSGATQRSNIEGGISNFDYAPDGRHFSFSQDVKLDNTVQDLYPDLPKANARIIDDLMYRHWSDWHDFAYSHVFFAKLDTGISTQATDIMTGERFDSPLNPHGGGEHIAWTHDGKQIAYTCKKLNGKEYALSTNSDIYLYDIATGKTQNLTQGMMGYDVEPAFSPDGKHMAWLSMERDGFEADRNRIFILELASGKKTELTKGFDQSAAHLNWSKDGSTLYFISGVRGTEQVYAVDAKTAKITRLSEGTHNYNSIVQAGDMLVGTQCSMSYPVELWTLDPRTGRQAPLTRMNEGTLKDVQWGDVKERIVKTTDGKDMLAWVIYPPNFDPSKKYPALLYCQGGPQSQVSQFFSYRWNFQLMAANGYIVIAPNRRGLPGFGQAWNDAISGDWGGQPMKDYLSAVDDLTKESYVDKDKLGCVGASYGGYSVYMLAGMHQKRFKTFISHCGLFNLESWYPSTEEMFFAKWDMKGGYWEKPQPKSYAQFSPHNLVGNWDTPMLVIHGEKDFRVPVSEGMQAFGAAQLQGIPSRFLYFPEEGHWVLGAQNGILWHRVFFDWLGRSLK